MAAEPVAQGALEGKQIAITGRLASMTRNEAVDWIRKVGGEYHPTPIRTTDYLVIGQQGWPLQRDGRLTQHMLKAQSLREKGLDVQIIPEDEFLGHLGLGERQDGIRRLYTTEQLSRILQTPVALLRSWVRLGLIKPAKTVHRLCYFNFEQVASAKVLIELSRRGVTSERIRKSLQQLGHWIPDAETSLNQLGILERGGRLLVRLQNGQLAEPSGQLQLDFGPPAEPEPEDEEGDPPPTPHLHRISRDWFEEAIRHEEEDRLEDAAEAYHQALLAGQAEPEICFNLGNVLYRLGRKDAASQRFMQAVEQDPEYVEAWNNLGNVFAETNRHEHALLAYQNALRVEPNYADAHFNLAETLEHLNRRAEARDHWRRYLKLDPHSSWARQVRERLESAPKDSD